MLQQNALKRICCNYVCCIYKYIVILTGVNLCCIATYGYYSIYPPRRDSLVTISLYDSDKTHVPSKNIHVIFENSKLLDENLLQKKAIGELLRDLDSVPISKFVYQSFQNRYIINGSESLKFYLWNFSSTELLTYCTTL